MEPALQPAPRVDVLGVGISCVDLESTVEIFAKWIANDARHYVCVTGMHGVMESQTDAALRDIHNASGLTTPDGMSMVYAGRWAGARISRVYGPDLMEAVFDEANEVGWSSYFLGGAPGVAEQLVATLRDRYPAHVVAGYESPPFRPLTQTEDEDLIRRINGSGADFVWVGLGTPKQERWMAEHRAQLAPAVLVGVGAAFNLLTGTVRQAPRWMQHSGLEWLFRLAMEPRRLWRRYLVNIPRFGLALVRRPPRLQPEPAAASDPV
jgi:N-acetylglucosaminyldiphosphoundecaprenol N-acetyl-beta-D-mannosaminyltransferase